MPSRFGMNGGLYHNLCKFGVDYQSVETGVPMNANRGPGTAGFRTQSSIAKDTRRENFTEGRKGERMKLKGAVSNLAQGYEASTRTSGTFGLDFASARSRLNRVSIFGSTTGLMTIFFFVVALENPERVSLWLATDIPFAVGALALLGKRDARTGFMLQQLLLHQQRRAPRLPQALGADVPTCWYTAVSKAISVSTTAPSKNGNSCVISTPPTPFFRSIQ